MKKMKILLGTSTEEGKRLKAAFVRNNYYHGFDGKFDLKADEETVLYLLKELAKK